MDMNANPESIKKFLDKLSPSPPPDLFHYTNPVGLHGILTNREIWATSIHYLNDSSEFLHAVEIARCQTILAEDLMEDELEILAINEMRSRLEKINHHRVFVVSFSEDSDRLSQWRAYCGTGGYSIGFESKALISRSEMSKYSLHKCIYDEKLQEQTVKDAINLCIKPLKDQEKVKNHEPGKLLERIALFFVLLILHLAPLFKHPGFEEEREWRLVSSALFSNEYQIRYRPTDSILIPYFAYKLCENNEALPIDSIVVGPTRSSDLSIRSLKGFIKSQNIDAAVLESEIPFRSL